MKSYKYRLFGYLLLVLTSSLVHAGLTGEFHENNQKKMFFSKKLILPGKENPADFTTEFDAGDRIYGIIYFDGGAADWRAPDKELIDIKVNGKRLSHMFGIDMRPLKRENLSYLPLEIIPNPSDAWQDHADAWSEWFLPSLSDGKNTIDLSVYGISGRITIDGWNSGHLKEAQENAKQAMAAAKENAAKRTKLPDDFITFADNRFKSEDLTEAKLIEYFKEGYRKRVTEVIAIEYPDTNEEWYVVKNEIDVPIRLQTWNMGFLYKHKDGDFYYVYVPFVKDYLGGGKYGNPHLFPQGSGEHVRIHPDNFRDKLSTSVKELVSETQAGETDDNGGSWFGYLLLVGLTFGGYIKRNELMQLAIRIKSKDTGKAS